MASDTPALSINQILINPHARLRRAYGGVNPSWQPKDLPIWDRAQDASSRTQAGAISMAKPVIRAGMHVAPQARGHEWRLSAYLYKNEQKTICFESGPVSCDDAYVEFPVAITGATKGVPWGINKTLTWSATDGNETYIVGDTQLELYALANDLAPVFRDDAINLELLQDMVLPSLDLGLDYAGWVEYVTRTAFTSSADPVAAVKYVNDYKDQAAHSYRYNVFNGQPRFSSFGNGLWRFNYDMWNAGRKEKTDNYYVLNCYDQAALLYLGLSLGIDDVFLDGSGSVVPDSQEKNQVLKNVGIFYKEPYGYIKETDLIGWGNVNNPFFDPKDDTSRVITDEQDAARKAEKKPVRDAYLNHKFVYLRKPGTQTDYKAPDAFIALDACAGPHPLQKDLNQYFSEAIDSDYTKKMGYYKDALDSNIKKGTKPDTFDDMAKDIDFGSPLATTDFRPIVLPREPQQLTRARFEKHHIGEAYDLYAQCVADKRATMWSMPIAFEKLIETAKSAVITAVNNTARTDKMVTKVHPFEVGCEGTNIIIDYWLDDAPPRNPYLTLTIDVTNGFDMACEALLGSIESIDKNSKGKFSLVTGENQAGAIHITGWYLDEDGTRCEKSPEMFVFGNLYFNVGGDRWKYETRPVSAALHKLISTAPSGDLPKVDPSTARFEGLDNLRYNVPSRVLITLPTTTDAAGATVSTVREIDVTFGTKDIVLTQDCQPVDGQPGQFAFSCVVAKKPESPSKAELHVVMAEATTLVVTKFEKSVSYLA